jgi:hypothetical protein
MTAAPYWIRGRGCVVAGGTPNDWDAGLRWIGPDADQGVEVLVASWQGAIIVRLKRNPEGVTLATITEIPWGPKGNTHGITRTHYQGPMGRDVSEGFEACMCGHAAMLHREGGACLEPGCSCLIFEPGRTP